MAKRFGDYKSGAMKRLQDKCKELNIEGACYDNNERTIYLDSPVGFRFAATGTHMINNWSYDVTFNEIAEPLLLDLAAGLEPCEEPNCDYCNEV